MIELWNMSIISKNILHYHLLGCALIFYLFITHLLSNNTTSEVFAGWLFNYSILRLVAFLDLYNSTKTMAKAINKARQHTDTIMR